MNNGRDFLKMGMFLYAKKQKKYDVMLQKEN
jgi:hypothetical protein